MNILWIAAFSYLFGKLLALKYEKENEHLKGQLVFVKTKRQQEKEKYLGEIYLLNSTIENLRHD